MSFLGVPVRRGEVIRQRVAIGEFADGSPVQLPVVTVGGSKPGPTLYLQAGLHGDEQTGIEVCRQVLSALDPSAMSGSLVAVPVANIPAHLSRTRGFLHEERWLIDVNRSFPGNPAGLLSERLAHVLFSEFVGSADLAIDLHSALDGCNIAPFSYVDPDDDQNGTLDLRRRVAHAFGVPYVYYKSRGSMLGTSDMTRSVNSQADLARRAIASVEMGESRRVTDEFVPIGVRGVFNALKVLGVLEGEPETPGEPRRFSTIKPVHAQHGGGLRMKVRLGDDVTAGQTLAEVVDVFGQTVEQVRAPADGFILRVMLLGAINTGAEVAWVCY